MKIRDRKSLRLFRGWIPEPDCEEDANTTLLHSAADIKSLWLKVAKLYDALHIRMKWLDNIEESRRTTNPIEYVEQAVPAYKIECFCEVDVGNVHWLTLFSSFLL